MYSNLTFLEEKWPLLTSLGNAAERYVYSDSNSCLMKLGLFGEAIVKQMLDLDDIEETEDHTQASRIKVLKGEGLVPKDIDDILYAIRTSRNKAAHDGYESVEQAKILTELAYKLGVWFMQTYGQWDYEPTSFIMPEDISSSIGHEALIKAQEEKIEELTAKVKETEIKPKDNVVNLTERKKRASESANKLQLSEKETRYIIDEQLRKVGWEVDTLHIRYSKGTRPQKGRNLAISEWPTKLATGDRGYADYALFVGLKLVGVIEAKRHIVDIPSVIDFQCKDYAKNIREEHLQYTIGHFGEYQVPFLFATNGRKYLKQLETKSGIWFLDVRCPANISKALAGWMSPEGIIELLDQDISKANQRLQSTGYEVLEDKDGLSLRYYQIKAIKKAEKAIINGQQKVLLSMATGTGKTRTILGIIYRFLSSNRFKRILFLVDRTALGEQTQDVFKEVKLEELATLDSMYDIKSLEDKNIARETKVHVATVQSLVKRILYNEEDTMPAVSDYDLIIIEPYDSKKISEELLSFFPIWYNESSFYVLKMLKWV